MQSLACAAAYSPFLSLDAGAFESTYTMQRNLQSFSKNVSNAKNDNWTMMENAEMIMNRALWRMQKARDTAAEKELQFLLYLTTNCKDDAKIGVDARAILLRCAESLKLQMALDRAVTMGAYNKNRYQAQLQAFQLLDLFLRNNPSSPASLRGAAGVFCELLPNLQETAAASERDIARLKFEREEIRWEIETFIDGVLMYICDNAEVTEYSIMIEESYTARLNAESLASSAILKYRSKEEVFFLNSRLDDVLRDAVLVVYMEEQPDAEGCGVKRARVMW